MPSVAITGANRGLGLALSRSFAADGWRVHACCRHPEKAAELKALGEGLTLHRLEVTDALQVSSLARSLADEPIDLLVNNAAVRCPGGVFGALDFDDWARSFAVNVMGPVRLAEQFAPLLAAGTRRQIVNISSVLGSIARTTSGGDYPYRTSKAALNMATRGLAADLAEQGVTVVAVHPGWLRSEIGGETAPLEPEEAAADLRSLFDRLGPEDSGGFFDRDGTPIPW